MKILLAVDGSKYSDAAVQALASKIRKEDADVLVLQVVEPRIFSTPPQMAAGYEPEMAEIMKEQFQQRAADGRPRGSRAQGRRLQRQGPRRGGGNAQPGFWTWRANGTPI